MKISSKRRRTKQEILEQKQLENQKQSDIENKLNELEELKQRMAELQHRVDLAAMVENQCAGWADQGKIKVVADGKIEIVDDPKEREYIMESRRKEKQQPQQEAAQGENLMQRFNQDEDDEEFE